MISSKIKNRIRGLEIKTKKILRGSVSGDNLTSSKGSGYEFDQIRPYEQGDDLRFIDWNGSARTGKLLYKQYFEERSRDVVICLDVSSSVSYSSSDISKRDFINEVSAVITFICEHARDNVKLVLFSDKVKEVVESGSGVAHTQKIIDTVCSYEIPENESTDFNNLAEYLIRSGVKNRLVLIISDFISESDFSKSLNLLNKMNELVAVECLDKAEIKFPKYGIINFYDMETGKTLTLNTDDRDISYGSGFLKSLGINTLSLRTQDDLVIELIKFFKSK